VPACVSRRETYYPYLLKAPALPAGGVPNNLKIQLKERKEVYEKKRDVVVHRRARAACLRFHTMFGGWRGRS
jgi:hypothetical protein